MSTSPNQLSGGVVVPDEAVEAAAHDLARSDNSRAFDPDRINAKPYEGLREVYRSEARAILVAAAPLIVAANQPAPDDDLRETVLAALRADWPFRHGARIGDPSVEEQVANVVVPALEAFVAAQVAAARADEERRLAPEYVTFKDERGVTHVRERAVPGWSSSMVMTTEEARAALAPTEDPHA